MTLLSRHIQERAVIFNSCCPQTNNVSFILSISTVDRCSVKGGSHQLRGGKKIRFWAVLQFWHELWGAAHWSFNEFRVSSTIPEPVVQSCVTDDVCGPAAWVATAVDQLFTAALCWRSASEFAHVRQIRSRETSTAVKSNVLLNPECAAWLLGSRLMEWARGKGHGSALANAGVSAVIAVAERSWREAGSSFYLTLELHIRPPVRVCLGGVKGDKQNLHKLIILTPAINKFQIIFIYTAYDGINIVLRHLRDIQGLTPPTCNSGHLIRPF